MGLTIEKKRKLSHSSDATMPTVVTIASSDAISSEIMTNRSTRVRARKSGRMRVKA